MAQQNSSLSDPNLEAADAKVTSETLLSQNDLLRKQLSLDCETRKTLTDSLVVSNAEAELFRRKYSELQTRMDTLGVEAVSKDRAKLEQRLLKAVSDLQLMNREKKAYGEQLLKLSETMLRYAKTTQKADPQAYIFYVSFTCHIYYRCSIVAIISDKQKWYRATIMLGHSQLVYLLS